MHYTTVAGGNASYEKCGRNKPISFMSEITVASADALLMLGVDDNEPVTAASVSTDASLMSIISFGASPK